MQYASSSSIAITACYRSGLEHLHIVTRDFAEISMLVSDHVGTAMFRSR